jgi:acetaldehyde dehydrogenase (acetylating)
VNASSERGVADVDGSHSKSGTAGPGKFYEVSREDELCATATAFDLVGGMLAGHGRVELESSSSPLMAGDMVYTLTPGSRRYWIDSDPGDCIWSLVLSNA